MPEVFGLYDFLARALAGGFGVALMAGPLGCFIVWRRMAYFGDTLAHSALLGVALGIILGLSPTAGTAAVCALIAVLLVALQRQRHWAGDTLLGILAHGALASGLVVLSFFETVRVDLMSYLFGDILAITDTDLLWIYGGAAVTVAVLIALWRPRLSVTVHADLAQVEGAPVTAVRLAYMLMVALVIAGAMKVVGVLLVTSLLIIPAAAARRFVRSPEGMALLAAGIGVAAVAGGLWGSYRFDTPSGPSVVVAALVLFAAGALVPRRAPGR